MSASGGVRGFTLIELIVLIVVFFGAVTSLLSVAIDAAKRVGENKDSSTAVQLAQEGAETVLANRRNPDPTLGWLAVTTGTTSASVPGFEEFTRQVTVTNSSSDPCLGSIGNCKLVVVTVSKSSQPLAVVTLMVAN